MAPPWANRVIYGHYVPWHPSLNRRCDRNVADGWAWNGSQMMPVMEREILAATLFRIYRFIGGDHPSLGIGSSRHRSPCT